SERDVFAARASGAPDVNQLPVREVMHQPVQLARPDEDLAEASARMTKHRIGCLPVVHENRLIGMLTRSDILGHEASHAPLPAVTNLRVADLMTRVPLTVVGDEPLLTAVALMMNAGVRHLP